jgi:hypothetical protein
MPSGDPRKSGRRIELPGNRYVEGYGVQQEAVHKYGADIPEPPKGEHLWVVTGLWRTADPSGVVEGRRILLDAENLLSIDGPGCYVCEQVWSPELEKQPCPGEPG